MIDDGGHRMYAIGLGVHSLAPIRPCSCTSESTRLGRDNSVTLFFTDISPLMVLEGMSYHPPNQLTESEKNEDQGPHSHIN